MVKLYLKEELRSVADNFQFSEHFVSYGEDLIQSLHQSPQDTWALPKSLSKAELSALLELRSYYQTILINQDLAETLIKVNLKTIKAFLNKKKTCTSKEVTCLLNDSLCQKTERENPHTGAILALNLTVMLINAYHKLSSTLSETEGPQKRTWISLTALVAEVHKQVLQKQALVSLFRKTTPIYEDVLLTACLRKLIGMLIAPRQPHSETSVDLYKNAHNNLQSKPEYWWADEIETLLSLKKVTTIEKRKLKTQVFVSLLGFKSNINLCDLNLHLVSAKLTHLKLDSSLKYLNTIKNKQTIFARWQCREDTIAISHTYHYSNLILSTRPNPASGKCFKPGNWDFYEGLNKTGVYFDLELFFKCLTFIEDQFSVNENCLLSGKLKESIMLNKPLEKQKYKAKKAQNNQARFSELYNLTQLFLLKNLSLEHDGPFYFQHFYDFRGRYYARGPGAPCGFSLFRYFYYYGISTQKQHKNIQLVKALEQLPELQAKLERFVYKMGIDAINKKLAINTVFFIAISVAKQTKSVFKEKATVEQFIEHGLTVLEDNFADETKLKNLEPQDFLEFKKECLILESLQHDTFKVRTIIKDVTASAIRELVKFLGPKNLEALRIVNMWDQYVWYDTYTALLGLFKDYLHQQKQYNSFYPETWELFQRKTTKKLLMTKYYSVTEYTAKKEFTAVLIPLYKTLADRLYGGFKERQKNTVILNTYDKATKIRLYTEKLSSEITEGEFETLICEQALQLFKLFFKWLETRAESEILTSLSSKELKDKFEKENCEHYLQTKNESWLELELKDGSKLPLAYFKSQARDHEYKNAGGNRLSYSSETWSTEVDLKKTRQALVPNIIHAMDAYMLRRVHYYSHESILAIHDAWLVNFTKLDVFIEAVSQAAHDTGLEYGLYGTYKPENTSLVLIFATV